MTLVAVSSSRRFTLLIVALGLLLLLASPVAAIPPPDWTRTVDLDGRNDLAQAAAIDSAGNVVVAAYKTLGSGNGYDAYAVKFDPAGNQLCTVTVDSGLIGGTGGVNSADTFLAVAIDTHDNIVLAGNISGPYPPYYVTGYIRKYDANCQPLWATPRLEYYSGYDSAWNGAWGVTTDDADNVYVAGNCFAGWYAAEHQWMIYKYNADGIPQAGFPLVYDYSHHYYIPDYSYSVAVDQIGNIVVVGVRGVSGYDGSLTKDLDWHVRKYNAAGTLQWEDTIDGAHLADYAVSVAIDGDGNPIVAGYSNHGTDNSTGADYDWLVVKYASAGVAGVGQRLWTHTFGSAPGRSDAVLSLAVTPADDMLVAGYQRDADGTYHGRIETLSGGEGSLIDAYVFDSPSNLVLTGLRVKSNRMALSGYVLLAGGTYDIFAARTTLAAPEISVPLAIDFDAILVGRSGDRSITVGNSGFGDLTLGTIGTLAAPFSLLGSSTCRAGLVIEPGNECTLDVRYSPSASGTSHTTLTVASDDPETPAAVIALDAVGAAIVLSTPDDGTSLDACAYYNRPTFRWTSAERFKSQQVVFTPAGGSRSAAFTVPASASSWTPPAGSVVSMLGLVGNAGGTIEWKVTGTRANRQKVESPAHELLIGPASPVTGQTISPVTRAGRPVLRWSNQCNAKFSVTFSGTTGAKSFNFTDTKPTDAGGTFSATLTPGQWLTIRKLVGDAAGAEIDWYVSSTDALKRSQRSGTQTFTLAP